MLALQAFVIPKWTGKYVNWTLIFQPNAHKQNSQSFVSAVTAPYSAAGSLAVKHGQAPPPAVGQLPVKQSRCSLGSRHIV